MARFNTGNPVGSKDPRDLSDNAQNIDEWSNGSGASFSDRLGVQRRTIAGMTDEFQSFLDGSAYDFLGDYAADIEVTSRNQVIREAGEFWRISAGTELPYTTTGAGMPEGGAFAAVGDAVLRQDLAGTDGLDFIGGTGTAAARDVGTSPTQVPDNDAINSRGFAESVESVSMSFAGRTVTAGLRVIAAGWKSGTETGGGIFVGRTDLPKTLHDGGKYISPTVPGIEDQAGATLAERIANFNAGAGETDLSGTGIFVRLGAEFRPENYGVFIYDTKADAEAGVDSSGAFMDAVAASRGGGVLVLPERKFINVGAGVATQPDWFFASTHWKGNFCVLVRTAPGVGLLVRGGASYQDIWDVEVHASSALAPNGFDAVYDDVAGTITPNEEHTGIKIVGARVNIRAESRGHRGFNYHITSFDGNSNAASYDLYGSNSGACGLYIEGTKNDLSVSRLRYRARGSEGPLFWITDSAELRQWDGFIYVENGMLDQSSPNLLPSQCYLGGASWSRWWVYSECQNQFNQSAEILATDKTTGCEIASIRQNRDQDSGAPSSNRWINASGDINHPFSVRNGPIYKFKHRAVRTNRSDEDYRVDFEGNDGFFGSIFCGGDGIGFSKQDQDGTAVDFRQQNRRQVRTFEHSGGVLITRYRSANGTIDAPTAFANGDVTHRVEFQPYNGSGYTAVAALEVKATSVGGGNKASGEIMLRTVRAGASALSDTLRIRDNGDVELMEPGRGIVMSSPNGTRYKTTVDDAGNLVTVAL